MLALPPHFTPSEDFLQVFDLMENSYNNIFLSGKAGTGKSTLLAYFTRHSRKNCLLLAPTGIAAMNVGGQTIHSFFGFPPRVMRPGDPDIRYWEKGNPKRRILDRLDTLIIDEISMVRADLLDAVSESLQVQFGHSAPFGGLQVVLVGDPFQLAPVTQDANQREDEDRRFGVLPAPRSYLSPWFFSAEAFKRGGFAMWELQTVHRQTDKYFLGLLHDIRSGEPEAETILALNERVGQRLAGDEYILLTSTNALADRENEARLAQIAEPEEVLYANSEGQFPAQMMKADSALRVKRGARVMALVNDFEAGYFNGSLGQVLAFEPPNPKEEKPLGIVVQFDSGLIHTLYPYKWENASLVPSREGEGFDRKILGTYAQYPLRLAWAVTIHKSQGLSFDRVRIDLGTGAFASGQLYVALSRCRTLEGLCLERPIRPQDARLDPVIGAFYQWFGKKRKEEMERHPFPRRPAKTVKIADSEAEKQRKEARVKQKESLNVAEGKLAREGLRWTAEELQQALRLFQEGDSLPAISQALQRKASAIGEKLKKEGQLSGFSLEAGFVFGLLPEAEEAKPENPSGDEWTSLHDQDLEKRWAQGQTLGDLVPHFQRYPGSLLMRLLNLNLIGVPGSRFESAPYWVEFRR